MENKVGFKTVQLLKDQTLGIGSYGAVCKAKCDDLLCAAKIIHPTLVDPAAQYQIAPQKEHRLPIRRFELECEFLSRVSHPNIVQFLGLYQDPETDLPVLLMELMNCSLTHFLENVLLSIPYHVQVNLCSDIAQALSYLHSNNIVHRDLSSNNVLLIGSIRAKVTDFGMASLGSSELTRRTFTMMPGTDVYMPPEAVDDKPVYTEKIDCFSFGVIVIQVLTRQFPKPGDRQVAINDPRYPGELKMSVPEIERRKNAISAIDSHHPLLSVSLDCLQDKPDERPTAHQLCERMIILKRSVEYNESVDIGQDCSNVMLEHETKESQSKELVDSLQRTTESQAKELEVLQGQIVQITTEKDDIIKRLELLVTEKDNVIAMAQQEVAGHIDEGMKKDELIELKTKELKLVTERLQMNEEVVAEFQKRIDELEKEKVEDDILSECRISKKLKWKMAKDAPTAMTRQCNAVVNGTVIYFNNDDEINMYNMIDNTWDELPECPHNEFSLAIVDDLPTIIGGKYEDKDYNDQYSNKLHSLTLKSNGMTWTEEIPPMPTKRSQTTSLCAGMTLVVAGGCTSKPKPKPKKKKVKDEFDYSDDEEEMEEIKLTTVEVMSIETHQWSTAADLPEPLTMASAAACGDRIYILGEILGDVNDDDVMPSRSVITCSRAALLQSRSRILRTLSQSRVWSKVAGLPVVMSTCVSFQGSLVAVGGAVKNEDNEFAGVTSIYRYDQLSNSWEVISDMSITRFACFAAVTGTCLIVVGGETELYDQSVEIATSVM